jgi:hypothetical protein
MQGALNAFQSFAKAAFFQLTQAFTHASHAVLKVANAFFDVHIAPVIAFEFNIPQPFDHKVEALFQSAETLLGAPYAFLDPAAANEIKAYFNIFNAFFDQANALFYHIQNVRLLAVAFAKEISIFIHISHHLYNFFA